MMMVPGSRFDSLISLCGSTIVPFMNTSSCIRCVPHEQTAWHMAAQASSHVAFAGASRSICLIVLINDVEIANRQSVKGHAKNEAVTATSSSR